MVGKCFTINEVKPYLLDVCGGLNRIRLKKSPQNSPRGFRWCPVFPGGHGVPFQADWFAVREIPEAMTFKLFEQ
jgi:hypothetical protein